MCDGTEPIDPDEVLYRRVLTDYYDPAKSPHPLVRGYHPNSSDTTGLSLTRAKYSSLQEEAARGRNPKGYYVAELRAADLFEREIKIVPKPELGNLGHCELPELTFQSRRSDRAIEIESILADLSTDLKGPFFPS